MCFTIFLLQTVTHGHCLLIIYLGVSRVHFHFFLFLNNILTKKPIEKDKKHRRFQGLNGN